MTISGFRKWLVQRRETHLLSLIDTPKGCAVVQTLATEAAVVPRPASALAVLPTEEELQRRVRPLGWDVETLAPDLAVPLVEFSRRDGKVKLRVQKSGRGWSLELTHRGEEGQILRFVLGKDGTFKVSPKGTSVLPTIEDALKIAAQVLAENPPKAQISETVRGSWYEPALQERVEVEIGAVRRGVPVSEVRAYGKTFTLRGGKWDPPLPPRLLRALQASAYNKHFLGVGATQQRVAAPGDWSVDIPADVPPERRQVVEKLQAELPRWLVGRQEVTWQGVKHGAGGTTARWVVAGGAYEALVQSGAGISGVRVRGRFAPTVGAAIVGPKIETAPGSVSAELVFPDEPFLSDQWASQVARRKALEDEEKARRRTWRGKHPSVMEPMPVQGTLFEQARDDRTAGVVPSRFGTLIERVSRFENIETMPASAAGADCPPTSGSIQARGFPKDATAFYRATAKRGTKTKSKQWKVVANSAVPLLQKHGVVIGPLLGCGQFGCAYEVQGDRKRVAKFTGDPSDAAAWQRVLDTVGRGAWPAALATTECVEVIPRSVEPETVAVPETSEEIVTEPRRRMFFMLQERVGPLTDAEVEFFNDDEIDKEVLGAAGVQGKGSRARAMGLAVAANIPWAAVSDLVATIRWLKRKGIVWHDLHGGNVMGVGRGVNRRFKIIDLGYSEGPTARVPVMADE